MFTKKQTAGNNVTLANVKKTMNTPIFKETCRIYNEHGEQAAMEYVGKFFGTEYRKESVARMFGTK